MNATPRPGSPRAWLGAAALALLCWPYIASGFAKGTDLGTAAAEVAGLGLPFPVMLAAGTVLVQLVGSALVVSGWLRWLGALGLAAFTVAATVLAHAFWSLEPGRERMREAIVFGEHLGLTGTFLFVAWWDLARDRGEAR